MTLVVDKNILSISIQMLLFLVFATLLVHALGTGKRIIGGQNAEKGQFPFQAEIISKETTFPINGATCGGSLISPNWVIPLFFAKENQGSYCRALL